MRILTHRWLEPGNLNFPFFESSFEAFENQLSRGFWLEFDINFSKDWVAFAFHDQNLARISNWSDETSFSDLDFSEILRIQLLNNCHFAKIEEIFHLVSRYSKRNEFSALHVKARFQTQPFLDALIKIFASHAWIADRVFLFDLTPAAARYIRNKLPKISLFASVAHRFDVARFSSCVGWTLLWLDEFLEYRSIYDWAWLDEWDRTDALWKTKIFYTAELFRTLRGHWFKIALVTPELHSSSPWLYGGESHQDCKDERLFLNRISEIASLGPDYVCTDYPSNFSLLFHD